MDYMANLTSATSIKVKGVLHTAEVLGVRRYSLYSFLTLALHFGMNVA
jgi:hypothetical protein